MVALMNGDFSSQSELSRNAKIAIIAGSVVVVVCVTIGLVLFFRARARGPQSSSSTPSVTTPGQTPGTNGSPANSVQAMEALNAKAIQESLKNTIVHVDDTNIVYDTEQTMTVAEKQRYGFPTSAEVRFKYIHPDPSAPVQVPILVITKAPQPRPSPLPENSPGNPPPNKKTVPR